MVIVQKVEQLYVEQSVPCSSQGIHPNVIIIFIYYKCLIRTCAIKTFLLDFIDKLLLIRIVQLVRTLISCIKNENSSFSPGLRDASYKKIYIISIRLHTICMKDSIANTINIVVFFIHRFDSCKNNNKSFYNSCTSI